MTTEVTFATDTIMNPVLKFDVTVPIMLQQMAEEQSYYKSIVKKQKLHAELSNLPRHHPLIREAHSDDGMQLLEILRRNI